MANLRHRSLAAELKRLREDQTDLSAEDVAQRVGVSERTINRIESAAYLPKEAVLGRLADLYGATSHQKAGLIKLRNQARTVTGWWISYGDVYAGTYLELEDGAEEIRSFQNCAVPGILQTEGYARATINAITPDEPDNVKRLETRVVRRTRFTDRPDPPRLHVVLDEAVLKRQVGGPDVMWDQISFLSKIASRPHVTIQVVPFSVGAYVGQRGPFVILGFAGENYPDVAYLETLAGDIYPEREPTLAALRINWERLTKAALTPEDSAGYLAELLEE